MAQESEIERELANYTFGELQEALADGSRNIAQRRKKSETKPKRANKNRYLNTANEAGRTEASEIKISFPVILLGFFCFIHLSWLLLYGFVDSFTLHACL